MPFRFDGVHRFQTPEREILLFESRLYEIQYFMFACAAIAAYARYEAAWMKKQAFCIIQRRPTPPSNPYTGITVNPQGLCFYPPDCKRNPLRLS